MIINTIILTKCRRWLLVMVCLFMLIPIKQWSMTWLSHLLKHLFKLNQSFFQLWKQYWQSTILLPTMNIVPIVILPTINVWCIQPPKYHNNDDLMSHLQKLTKVCVTNKEDTTNHKLQYFLNSLKGQTTNWFAKYETTHLVAT